MDELKKEYLLLFNGITDTIKSLEKTMVRLKQLQKEAEELCITGADAENERQENVLIVEDENFRVMEEEPPH